MNANTNGREMMATNDGFPSLAEAFEQASTESEAATTLDVEDAQPASEAEVENPFEQAEESVEEQPESEAASTEVEEEESLFGDLEDEESEEPEEAPTAPLLEQAVELPDGSTASVQDLRDGYLRQADYTRKTQELAAQRKQWEQQNETAARLQKAISENPVGLLRSLAQQVGVEVDLRGVNPAEVKLPNRSEIEAEIERRVQEGINNDPRVQEALANQQISRIDQEFADLETAKGVTLSQQDKKVLLRKAAENDGAPLALVYDALMAQVEAKRAQREAVKKASTKKSNTRAPERDVNSKPTDIREAYERALAQME